VNELGAHGVASLVFAAVVFAVFIWDRLPIATVSLAILALLPLGFQLFPLQLADGRVDPLRFLAGFGNPALVAICALMIVGQGLVVTGALEPVARRLAVAFAAHPRAALLGVLVLGLSVSGVINDTPVVVLLIPLLLAAAAKAKVAAAGMLLPMNYSVLIGGMATTIGTSTNLIVVAIAASLGVGPLGMFGHFDLVALAAVPALAYLWLVAPRLLANVPARPEHLSDDVFDAELNVTEGSWLDGRPLGEALEVSEGHLSLVDVRRGTRSVARLPSMVLRAGDRLVLRDTAVRLKELESLLKATLHDVQAEAAGADDAGAAGKQRGNDADKGEAKEKAKDEAKEKAKSLPTAVVAQLIVMPGSPLVGRSLREERVGSRYDLVVVGMRSQRQRAGWQREGLADRRIAAGDILLVQGHEEPIRLAQREGIGLLLDERFALPRQDKAVLALVTIAVVVVLAATKALPISLAALGGAMVLIVARCLSWHDVAQSLSAKVILLVAASLALGDALLVTGATDWLARGLAAVAGGIAPAWLAALLIGLMGLITNFVSNNAAAAIGTPLGISLAHALGAPPESFVLAVLFGCNLCYLTPMGYQTNLLVMNAGGYRFGDFLRVGGPLFVIMWAALSWLLAWRYGL
jgi:di/tricarboxylate transporter